VEGSGYKEILVCSAYPFHFFALAQRVSDWSLLQASACSSDSFHMFIGEYAHTIDEKRRLALPSKFHKSFEKKAVITRGLDTCLFVFPEEEWSTLAHKLGGLPLGQSDARGFIRLMLAGAMDVSLDNLGRILVPDYLKEYAVLQKQVIITGVLNRLEIWDEARWKRYKLKTEKDVGDIAERLGELGV